MGARPAPVGGTECGRRPSVAARTAVLTRAAPYSGLHVGMRRFVRTETVTEGTWDPHPPAASTHDNNVLV